MIAAVIGWHHETWNQTLARPDAGRNPFAANNRRSDVLLCAQAGLLDVPFPTGLLLTDRVRELHATAAAGTFFAGGLVGYTAELLMTVLLLVLTLRALRLPGASSANVIFAVCTLFWSAGGLAYSALLASGAPDAVTLARKVIGLLDSLNTMDESSRVANDRILMILVSACVLQDRFHLT